MDDAALVARRRATESAYNEGYLEGYAAGIALAVAAAAMILQRFSAPIDQRQDSR